MRKVGITLSVVALVIMGFVAGCIGGTQTQGEKVKVAVLFDVGGRGDLSFNDMAYLGAERAKKELGVEVEYMTPKSREDMVPLLKQLAESKEYDLLVLIGFLWTTPLDQVADQYPDQKFALIDSTTGKVRENEVDILFREQEAAALIGVIASGMAYELGGDTIGAVAGMDIPPLWKFHIGYLYGAKYFEKKTGKPVKLLWQYTGTFTDTQVGYTTGMQLLQQGAKVLYGLAGLTHVGMFDAVIDWNKQGKGKALAIGQDASQEWYAPEYIPISGAKRVDVAVYTAIEMVVKNQWKGGIMTLGLKEGGVGYWNLDGVRQFAEFAQEGGILSG
ncbi:MAG: basic rane protein [Pyrococcus sp.]|nr:basic rane protein [Pyrococcus sp.]